MSTKHLSEFLNSLLDKVYISLPDPHVVMDQEYEPYISLSSASVRRQKCLQQRQVSTNCSGGKL
jgi:hypothetical protein